MSAATVELFCFVYRLQQINKHTDVGIQAKNPAVLDWNNSYFKCHMYLSPGSVC